jgi:hypothetical protein
MEPNTNTTQARALLLAALESYGSDALEHAERARALVGIDGIRDIAESLSRDDDMPHESARVLGALAALLGESDPPQTVFGTEESAAGAFDFVSAGGYFGVWDGIEG